MSKPYYVDCWTAGLNRADAFAEFDTIEATLACIDARSRENPLWKVRILPRLGIPPQVLKELADRGITIEPL